MKIVRGRQDYLSAICFWCTLIIALLWLQPRPMVVGGPTALPGLAGAAFEGLFIENVGQFGAATPDSVAYRVASADTVFWLAEDGIWLTPTRGKSNPLKLVFLSSGAKNVRPIERSAAHFSYFTGRDPAGWQASVAAWGGVRYEDLYPAVDLVVSLEGGEIKLALAADDAAALHGVRLKVEGAEALQLREGHLWANVAGTEFPLPLLTPPRHVSNLGRPQLYGSEVHAPFANPADSAAAAGQTVEDDTDQLEFSTFLGGADEDHAYDLAVDKAGNIYVAGRTSSVNFPTSSGIVDSTLNGLSDAFIAKLTPDGKTLLFATLLGGSNYDTAYGLALDEAGNAYVSGLTDSSDFPTTASALQSTIGGSDDAFVAKINPNGTQLLYATFLGGSGDDYSDKLVVDGVGQAHVVGRTASSNFPTTQGAYDTTPNGGEDAFVVKLNSAGTAAVYATVLGGNADDQGRDIAIDGSGNVYLTGKTASSNFPTTPGVVDPTFNTDDDAFAAKLSASGSQLLVSTYWGSGDNDRGNAIAVDRAGRMIIAGETNSTGLQATIGAYDPTYNGGDADVFVTYFDEVGFVLWNTFLGGSGDDRAYSLALGDDGTVYVGGRTNSFDFSTTEGAFDTVYNGNQDAFVAGLSSDGTALDYSTFLGGTHEDRGAMSLVWLGQKRLLVGGRTFSVNFPTTPGVVDTSWNGSHDGFIAKLDLQPLTIIYIPASMSRYIESYFGPNESEPNNTYLEADGPLINGRVYFGSLDNAADTNDYYWINLPQSATVTIRLENIPLERDYDLALRSEADITQVIALSNKGGSADEVIRVGLGAGVYYIQVNRYGTQSSIQQYHLRVDY